MDKLQSMTRAEQISYWVGVLCIAIGRGKFRDEVQTLIDYYQSEAFDRGLQQGRAEKKSKSK